MPGAACPGHALFTEITAPMTRVVDPQSSSVLWHGEIKMPSGELAELARSHCVAAEFLRFARVPWTATRGDTQVLGDLRYDRERELGFAEIELPTPVETCPKPAPWLPPRADLLARP
jgi:hypothetical protein